jgi:hypothetical protein
MSTNTLAGPVTISGLDRLEASALRHAMGSDDPFLDNPIVIDTDLIGVINMLTSVHERLYGPCSAPVLHLVTDADPSTQPDAKGNGKQISQRPVVKDDPAVSPSVLQAGKGVRWGVVVSELESGNIEEFVTTQKSASAASTKSALTRKYRGLHVELKSNGDTSQIKVRLGDYES